ncbi:DUF1045 domain-containing protein [Bradyrhizobium cosmicum]|uniref:DUF1045 domain-containing protein n=1 Tax=Bradyrhizobium cosmicum TaxID=1404864 RepID=UPI0028E1CD7B|nr:DUF1045 domain-containing protein [Bradyrhizobium cosmicum]
MLARGVGWTRRRYYEPNSRCSYHCAPPLRLPRDAQGAVPAEGGYSVEELERALRAFVTAWPSCPIGPLKIDLLGGFFCAGSCESDSHFAGPCLVCIVEEFDRFRAPLSQGEFQRRLCSPLNEIETTHLVRWGYPYVFDHFRFHMTLTDFVPAESQPEVRRELDTVFGTLLSKEYSIDALSLFVQIHSGADFVVRSQFTLRSRSLLKEAV